MNKYEVMIITKADLKEEEKEPIFKQFQEAIVKNAGQIINQQVWLPKSHLTFPIKKQREGLYYLIQFSSDSSVIAKLRQAFRMNESVLRFIFTRID
jgi:small subunit ribosomal protein S6